MSFSMQVVRGLGALTLCAAVSAYAFTQPVLTPDEHEAVVAHSRLEIVVVSGADNAARYQVASIRVGAPITLPPEPTRRAIPRPQASAIHG